MQIYKKQKQQQNKNNVTLASIIRSVGRSMVHFFVFFIIFE